MPMQKIQFRVPQSPVKEAKLTRLDQVLVENFSAQCRITLSRGQARKLIVAGAVYLNRKRVRIASKEVRPGAHIEVYADLASLRETAPTLVTKSEFHFSAADILFEDEGLIIVRKHAGIPTQPTLDDARANLYQGLKVFLRKREGKPDAYLGLQHRLDVETSGIVLFTKDPQCNSGVAGLFREHKIQKRYLALCSPSRPSAVQPGDSWTVRNHLGIVGKTGKKKKFGAVLSGGDPAETRFQCLGTSAGVYLIAALPITGRTHQIRVHLSELGLPILGDPFYAGEVGFSGQGLRVMLHAASLQFRHPQTSEDMLIQCPPPEDFLGVIEKTGIRAPLF